MEPGILILFILIIILICIIIRTKTNNIVSFIEKDSYITLPLFWSDVALKTKATLSTDEYQATFDIIPDTGSNIMIVSGKGCQGCDPKKGEWDLQHGVPINGKQLKTIRYSGGFVSDYYIWSAKYLNGRDGMGPGLGIVFGVIVKTNSPQNVLGLQPTRSDTNQREEISLMDSLGAKVATFDFPKMELILEKELTHIPPKKIQNTIPLVFTPSPRRIPIADLKSITYQSKTLNFKDQKVLFDTGALWTIVPANIYDKVFSGLPPKITSRIRGELLLTFHNSSTDVPMVCPLEYVVKGPNRGDMIIGSKWLQKYLVAFDYPSKRIVFGRS